MALTSEADRIIRVEILTRGEDGGKVMFLMDDHVVDVALSDVRAEAEVLLNALPDKRTLEQKKLADAAQEVANAQKEIEDTKVQAAQEVAAEKAKAEDAQAIARELNNRNKEMLKVIDDKLTPEEKAEIKEFFPDWEVGKNYTMDGIKTVAYNGKLYQLVQAHTSQADWTPDVTPALWSEVSFTKDPEGNIYPEFKHPTGAHDAYHKGDRVVYNGELYESLADNNAYSPDEYAPNWKKIVE